MSNFVRLSEVCTLEKSGLNPQTRPNDLFAHYSIPAFDDGQRPVVEQGEGIKSQKTRIERGVVLVSKLNPRIPRVWFVNDEHENTRICSTEFVPFRPKLSRLLPEYLAFALRHLLTNGEITGTTSAATKSRERARPADIAELKIPLPSLAEQRDIVDILSRAEGIVRLRREAQKKAAEIIPALFLDMFGDPATNPKGWVNTSLAEVADVQGGLQVTKARETLPLELPYLRVANVYRTHIDLSEVKHIRLTESEYNRVRLERGDLLVVEGHGNPAEVGRVGIWDGSIAECVHQNHLIRVRCCSEKSVPEFLWAFLNSDSGRQQLLQKGKTTSGLNTISTSNVKACQLMAAPLHLQKTFAVRVGDIHSVQSQQSASTVKAEATFDAMLWRAFQGHL